MLLTSWLASLKNAFPIHSRRYQKRGRMRRSLHTIDYAGVQSLEERVLLSAINDTPTANPVTINVTEDLGPQLITLGGDDGDPEFIQQLTYAIASNPAHGTLSGLNAAAGTVLYTPAPNYNGPDSFTYTVKDDAAQVLSLEGTVEGNLTSPGQTDTFSFTLANDTQVYFDSLRYDSNLTWTLAGPTGTISGNFTNTDWVSQGTPIRNLVAGNYTFTIDRNADSTGSYKFRLLNITSATPITPGTQVDGVLNPTIESKLYQFNATAGSRYYFDAKTSNGIPNASWRVYDQYGLIVPGAQQNINGGDFGTLTLPSTGTYYVLVEGYPNEGGTSGDFHFNIIPVTTAAPTALTLGNVVNGNIATPGQEDTYTFTLAAKTSVYFDSHTNDGLIYWKLQGPTSLGDQPFNNTDWANGGAVRTLAAGTYTITIHGSTDHIGTYEFRLMNLASGTLVTPTVGGVTVNGTLSPPSEADIYKFTATAGNRFDFQALALSGDSPNARWRLVDPAGNIVSGSDRSLSSSQATLTATYAGTYTLLVEGYVADSGVSGSYSFKATKLTDVVIPPVTGTAYSPGSVMSSTIGAAGEVDDYKFTLGADTLMYMDGQTTNGYMRWTLTGPSGTFSNVFVNSDWSNGNPVLKLVAGTYKLSVSADASQTGAYRFSLKNMAAATTLTPGTPISSTLSPVNESDLYKFTAAANSTYFFNASGSSGIPNAYWRLIDPFGNPVPNGGAYLNNQDFGPLTLPYAGTYTLLLEGYQYEGGSSGTYNINVIKVPTIANKALTLGTTYTGNQTVPGVVDTYTFTVATKTNIAFDSFTPNSNVLWSLSGPNGTSSGNFFSYDGVGTNNPIRTLVPGTYTFKVRHFQDTTGSYQFRLLNLAAATPITPGTPVNGTLAPNNETDIYKFNANAGDIFFFDAGGITGSIPNAYWRVADSNGNVLGQAYMNNGNFGPLTLPSTGTYTVLVEGYVNESGTTGDYTFNVVPVVNPAPQTLTLGNIVSGDVGKGQSIVYNVTLGARSLLYFDSNTNDSTLNWTLKGPGGEVTRAFSNSDWSPSNPVMNLAAGAYTLTVFGNTDAAGHYQFRLLNLANATTLTPGTPVSGTFDNNTETDAYKFNAVAGNRFNFDSQALASAPNAWWRLIDPLGNMVANTWHPAGTDFGPITIPYTGTYTLLIEGWQGEGGGTATYTFNVDPQSNVVIPPVTGTALALNTVTTNTISVAGEVDNYKFTLSGTAYTLVYMDGLVNDSNKRWTLTGPNGTISRNLYADWAYDNGPYINLPPGTYQLAISADGGNTGTYKFNLKTFAAATPLTPGTPVSSTLDPANETDMYKFNGVAGDKYYFDTNPISGITNAVWRLVDPYGRIVPGASTYLNNQDFGPITLPYTGTYTILVEGYWAEGVANGSYNINVIPANDVLPAQLTSTPANVELTVLPVNDAPVLDVSGSPTLTNIAEDNLTSNGNLVSEILASVPGLDMVTDVDDGAVEGIAIYAAATTNGKWQYSLDNGTNWSELGAPSITVSRLLAADATTRIRFVPHVNYNGPATISFRAWDQTAGTNGGTANTTTRGGSTAFSINGELATITVTPVNDAPVLATTGSPTLTSIPEDNTANVGTLISVMLASVPGTDLITDVDAGAVEGIAVYATSSTNGNWQYTINNGTNWLDLNTSSVAASRLLAVDPSTKVRFIPNANFNGTATISFRAWDRSTGANGGTADTTTRGGTTAFSTGAKVATITVTAVNDAPVLDVSGAPTLTTILEDNVTSPGNLVSQMLASVPGLNMITDVDAGAVEGIAIYAANNTNGKWQFSLNNGGAWTDVGAASVTSSLLLASDAATKIRFVPNANYNGSSTISFRGWDRTTGTNGGTADTTVRGGSTAFSTNGEVATITITSVNDAPVLDVSGSPTLTTILEDNVTSPGNLISQVLASVPGLNMITDNDAGALEGIAIYAANNTNGKWQYSLNNGTAWTDVGAASVTSSLLLASDAATKIRFVPNANYNGSSTISFRGWDRTTGTNGGTADTTVRGGSTAFSTNGEVATITITSVNDAPVLDTSGAPTLTTIHKNETATSGTAIADMLASVPGLNMITDNDTGALEGIVVYAANSTNGTWQYTVDNGTNWLDLGAVTATSARLLSADANTRIRFVPNLNFTGNTTISFRAWDRTSGTNGALADTSVKGGSSAFSLAAEVATLSVIA